MKQNPGFPGIIWSRQHMIQALQAHNHAKYDNNVKDWYFRFDDDKKISNKYILSITWTSMG